MRESTRVIFNTLTSWAATLTNGLIGFFLVPFLLLKLGKEGYGLTALVGTIIGLAVIVDMGLRAALSRQLTEQIARKDKQRFNELASSATLLYLTLGLLCSGVCIAFAPQIARLFNVSETLMPQGIFLIRWYGSVSILISFIGPVFSGTLTGLHRFDLINLITTLSSLAKGLGLFLILQYSATGLYGWAGVNAAASLASLLASILLAYRLWPSLRLSPALFRTQALKPLFSLGGYMFGLQLTNTLSGQAHPVILTTFLGPAAVALYSPAVALTAVFRPLILALADQMHPLATKFHVSNDRTELQAVLIRGTRYTVLMGIPVCVILIFFAEPITRIWLQKSLHDDYRIVAHMLVAWAMVDLLTYTGGTQWAVLLGMQKLKFLVWTQLPFALVNIALSTFLVGYTSWGVLGVVIPMVLIGLIRRPILAVHTAHACGLSARKYFSESYLRPILVLAALSACAWLMAFLFPGGGIGMLVVHAGIVGGLWVVLCWSVGLTTSDRQIFSQMLRQIVGRLGVIAPHPVVKKSVVTSLEVSDQP